QKVSKGSLKSEVYSMKFKDRRFKTEDSQIMDDRFELFWSFARIKAGKARARRHYEQAIASMNGHADPHGYLLDRWKLYQQSGRGQSEYAWEPCAWLRDGHYDDDPETWKDKRGKHVLDSRNQRIDGNPPAGYGTLRPPG
ncbi:MAG: hypothetical protein JW829_21395, partial [Pirellulales bacterium]|nr:hypothetical protein [Pirellulales bacterium]